jgi:hypothetical protein
MAHWESEFNVSVLDHWGVGSFVSSQNVRVRCEEEIPLGKEVGGGFVKLEVEHGPMSFTFFGNGGEDPLNVESDLFSLHSYGADL